MTAIDDLWKEAKQDQQVEWHHRMLVRLREALELGYAQGRLDMRSADEAALLSACVSLGVPARTTDALIKAVRDARVPGLEQPR
jgi:hypothetical protein